MNDLFISFLKAFYFSLHAESNLIKLAFFFKESETNLISKWMVLCFHYENELKDMNINANVKFAECWLSYTNANSSV